MALVIYVDNNYYNNQMTFSIEPNAKINVDCSDTLTNCISNDKGCYTLYGLQIDPINIPINIPINNIYANLNDY